MEQPITPAAPAAETTNPPASFDLTAYRQLKANGETPSSAVTEPQKPVDETPDPEVEADPELRKAIDELEAPKDNETPAEKRARTIKHKEAARKGFQTRLVNKATRLERENTELRQRLQAPVGQPHAAAAVAHRPAPKAEASDPSDPEPTLDTSERALSAFIAKHPDHPDPYAGLIAEHNRALSQWDRRQADRTTAAERATAQQTERARQVGERTGKHAEHARGVHRDFDTAIGSLATAIHGHQADEAIADALSDIEDPKVGGEVLYRLASQLDATLAAIKAGPRALLRHIGAIERDITAAAPKPAPAAPLVTAAPAPHSPVIAASSASSTFDPKKSGGALLDEYRRSKAKNS
jgi:hypothetical protein